MERILDFQQRHNMHHLLVLALDQQVATSPIILGKWNKNMMQVQEVDVLT